MTLNQIHYFLEAARHLCFSTAAQNLYMTQPAFGRQISALEKELNMQLFYRTTRTVKLTPAGRYLFEQWSRIMDEFDDSIRQAKNFNEGYSGNLLLGILEDINLSLFFTGILATFEEKYPNIKINMKQYSFGELRQKLAGEELDGILTYSFDIQDQENFKYQNLYKYQPCWAIPLANPLSKRTSLSVADLKNEEFILTASEDSPLASHILISLCKKEGGFTPRIQYADSLEEVILRLETSNKCTLINQGLRIAKSNKIKTFPFEDSYFSQVAYFAFAWMKDHQNTCLKLFIEHLSHHPKISKN